MTKTSIPQADPPFDGKSLEALAGPLLDEDGKPVPIYPNTWVGTQAEFELLFPSKP